MTTIIVVVVVALVFFVAVCVVAFMIWKREAEMRTDSIRAIEENLERLTQEMSPGQEVQDRQGFAEKEADISYMESLVAQSAAGQGAAYRILSNGSERTARLSGAAADQCRKNLLEYIRYRLLKKNGRKRRIAMKSST